MKEKSVVVKMLFHLWMLPQTAVGMVFYSLLEIAGVKLVSFKVKNDWGFDIMVVTFRNPYGSVSLGGVVFLALMSDRKTLDHELGHTIQSMMLGPLYLLVIGLPSICWATLKGMGCFKGRSYYSFYSEKWADKIAGIKR